MRLFIFRIYSHQTHPGITEMMYMITVLCCGGNFPCSGVSNHNVITIASAPDCNGGYIIYFIVCKNNIMTNLDQFKAIPVEGIISAMMLNM